MYIYIYIYGFFYQESPWSRNAAVPKSEVMTSSPISDRLGDGDTRSTHIFICAKEEH